jgi:hypothetical protein
MEGARSLPVDWGHAGVAFLLCCPDHPEAVGFLAQSG